MRFLEETGSYKLDRIHVCVEWGCGWEVFPAVPRQSRGCGNSTSRRSVEVLSHTRHASRYMRCTRSKHIRILLGSFQMEFINKLYIEIGKIVCFYHSVISFAACNVFPGGHCHLEDHSAFPKLFQFFMVQ